MCTKPEQDPQNLCDFSDWVVRVSNKSGFWGYKPHIPERLRGIGILEIFSGKINRREHVSVAVALYVTTLARLKLYEYLREFGTVHYSM